MPKIAERDLRQVLEEEGKTPTDLMYFLSNATGKEISRQTINGWLQRNNIPYEYVFLSAEYLHRPPQELGIMPKAWEGFSGSPKKTKANLLTSYSQVAEWAATGHADGARPLESIRASAIGPDEAVVKIQDADTYILKGDLISIERPREVETGDLIFVVQNDDVVFGEYHKKGREEWIQFKSGKTIDIAEGDEIIAKFSGVILCDKRR